MATKRDFWTVKKYLSSKGYKVTNTYIGAILDYLDYMPEDYTIMDWLKYTEANYPEELRENDE